MTESEIAEVSQVTALGVFSVADAIALRLAEGGVRELRSLPPEI